MNIPENVQFNTPSPNFFKVEREIYIDELMQKNPYKLFVLVFSVDSNFNKSVINEGFTIKKNIKKIMNQEEDTIFLYINLMKFIVKENKYSKYITQTSLPFISFYFNFNNLARINNAEYSVFDDTYNKIKVKLADHFKLAKQNISSNSSNMDNNNDNNDNNDISKNNQNVDEITEHIREQRKLEELEKLKKEYLIKELTKLKKAKEIQEKIEN